MLVLEACLVLVALGVCVCSLLLAVVEVNAGEGKPDIFILEKVYRCFFYIVLLYITLYIRAEGNLIKHIIKLICSVTVIGHASVKRI